MPSPLSSVRIPSTTCDAMSESILSFSRAKEIAAETGTPVYVYDASRMTQFAREALDFPAPYGLTVRYAIKAAPTRALLEHFADMGLHFDASSGFEAHRLIRAGVEPARISLSTQELPDDFMELANRGVTLNACSLNQLERYGQALPGTGIGLRFNPGLGSGGTNRTNVGGPASSFGIWYEHLEKARAIAGEHDLNVFRIHTHIGSGSDPEVWKRVAQLTLDTVEAFPSVTCMNMGGGYKVSRVKGETATDLQRIGNEVNALLEGFAERTGREIHLEIEPGTCLIANAGAVLSRVQDIVDTGPDGYLFYKLDCGMTEILRPSLYGSQHPIDLLQPSPVPETTEAVVVGHCCESGDILTPAPGDPEALSPRMLPAASVGDFALIGGAGAYCSAMSASNYNSFPQAPEVLLEKNGGFRLIRKRQTLDQILGNEL